MPYRLPSVTYQQLRETLIDSYSVQVKTLTIAPDSPKPFQAVHCSRKLADQMLEVMYEQRPDGDIVSWAVLDNIFRCLHINAGEDGLFGLEF